MVHFPSRIATLVFLILSATTAHAQALFEGYYKVTSAGAHVGYSIVRYQFDTKKKQFTAQTFLRTGKVGGDITEATSAVADESLNPISYQYISTVGKSSKMIEAKFKKNHMSGTITEDGKKKTFQRDLPKGVFLSAFTIYTVLKSKTGIQVGPRFEYSAVSEEDADVVKADLLIQKEDQFDGVKTYRILNRFKDQKFENQVTDRGEILSTIIPASALSSVLVAKPQDAVGDFGLNATAIKGIFGDVPVGTNNVFSRRLKAEALGTEKPAGKQQGVPQGENIIIKAEPSKKGSDKGE